MSDDLAQSVTTEVHDEVERRDAVEAGNHVVVAYNANQSIWELKFLGTPDWLIQLDGFRGMENTLDVEKVLGLVHARGWRLVGSTTWQKFEGGWAALVTRIRSDRDGE